MCARRCQSSHFLVASSPKINVCPVVDITKAISLGLPHHVDAKDIIRDFARNYILKKE